jgi:GTPase SAR1 family protein
VHSAELPDQKEAQRLLDEATKNGYVTSQSIVIVLVGIAGSGKSSFKRLVLNLPPAKDRISTPLAERAIRNLSISRAVIGDSNTVNWEMVDSEELLKMVADAIKEVGAIPEVSTPYRPRHAADVNPGASWMPTQHYRKTRSSKKPSQSHNSDASRNSNPPFEHHVAKILSAQQHNLREDDPEEKEEFDSCDDRLLPLIQKSKGSGRLLGVHWVYIIDTGGQPQFLQLLPAFIKNISSCVCFLKLDEGLDDKPMVKFFDESGAQCGKSYPSEHTNLQLVESCVRTIHSRCCLQSEASPNFFVVGTHRDEFEKHPHTESIEEKNIRLKSIFQSLQQNLTFYKADGTGRLIFPLNCKNPDSQDKEVAAVFRKCVMDHCPEPTSKIPLAWFILEERIRQYAAKKEMAYVEKDVCFKIAKKLHMNDETFQVALNHLLKNIFRSYSNLIFCDTQVVLLKLTELVQHLRETIMYGVKSEDINFKNEGVISVEFLSRFPRFFSDTFTPECFIHILRELLVIADLRDGKYFMPCLLKELSEKDFQLYRHTSNSLSPLLLCLDGGCLPNGLFTSLIASLKNDHGWTISMKNFEAACLYQNCVRFRLPAGLPGVITLIASFSFVEIHLDCRIESVDKACARVFSDVKSGLEASWRVLYPGAVSFRRAFFCSGCAIIASASPGSSSQQCPAVIQSHHATLDAGGMYETCSRDDSLVSPLCDSKLRWIRNTSESYVGKS